MTCLALADTSKETSGGDVPVREYLPAGAQPLAREESARAVPLCPYPLHVGVVSLHPSLDSPT